MSAHRLVATCLQAVDLPPTIIYSPKATVVHPIPPAWAEQHSLQCILESSTVTGKIMFFSIASRGHLNSNFQRMCLIESCTHFFNRKKLSNISWALQIICSILDRMTKDSLKQASDLLMLFNSLKKIRINWLWEIECSLNLLICPH